MITNARELGSSQNIASSKKTTLAELKADEDSLVSFKEVSDNFLPSSGSLQNDLDLNGNKIPNLPNPSIGKEPATKSYVDSETADLLPKAGGTLTGNINMGGKTKVFNLAPPKLSSDAATKSYVDVHADLRLPKAGGMMTGNLDMQRNKIVN